jgi:glutathione S-transferase
LRDGDADLNAACYARRMITVYHARRARSVRLLWLLEELGVAYEARPLEFSRESLHSQQYMKLHPLGQVPVMQDGDITMIESGAILEYLLERYGNGRLQVPASAGWPARSQYLQWFHFGEASLAKQLSEIVRNRFGHEPERVPASLEIGRRRFVEALQVIETELAGKSYICGEEFSAADIMVSYPITMGKIVSELPPGLDNALAYMNRLKQRPAYAKAWA